MSFQGFLPQSFQFLADLIQNNEKRWFEAHRSDYEKWIRKPSEQWVESMGDLLKIMDPGIHAIPKANKSLFKIYRDTRFSANKLPLKDHVGILLWSGRRKRMECSGFYLHFDQSSMFLGCGIRRFSSELTKSYLRAISAPQPAEDLHEILTALEGKGYEVSGKTRKRHPRGLAELSFPDLALFTGMSVIQRVEPLSLAMDSGLLPFAFDHYKNFLPLHEWLKEHLGS